MNRAGFVLAVLVHLTGVSVEAQVPSWDDEWYLRAGEGCALYVVEIGQGRPVVVLHGGWGAEHSYLLDAFQGLWEEYRFVFYDQRGSLRSPCPIEGISVEQHVQDLERLRQELGLERMILVGHSMGTFLAMSYLERFPARVEGLVLLGALLPRTPTSEQEAAKYQQEQQRFREFMERPEVGEILRAEGLDRDDLSDRQRTHAWRVRFAAANIFRVDRWRAMKGGRVFYNQTAAQAAGQTMPEVWDFTDDLRDLAAPVTVINGDHDLVGFGGELHRQMLDPLDNVEFVLIEAAGHNAWIDRPEEFRAHLRRALGKYAMPSQTLR